MTHSICDRALGLIHTAEATSIRLISISVLDKGDENLIDQIKLIF